MAKKNDPQPSSQKRSRSRTVLRWLFHPRRILLIGLAASSPFWFPAIRNALPELSNRAEYRFDPSQININEPPHWVPHDLVDQVVVRGQLGESLSILDDEATEKVALAFRDHPWVAEVVLVQKRSFPSQVNVRLIYREPVALVEKRSGFYPLDKSAVLLPPEDLSLSETADYLKIRGVLSMPSDTPGTRWEDPLVQGAARLANVLKNQWIPLGLKAVVVPPRTQSEVEIRDAVFVLESTGGSRILWGRAPGTEAEGELNLDKKLGRLRKYIADFGTFDSPAGPYEIDIRQSRQISRKKLNVTRDASRETIRE